MQMKDSTDNRNMMSLKLTLVKYEEKEFFFQCVSSDFNV